MARKIKRSRARRSFKIMKRSSRSSGMGGLMATVAGAGIYGAVRAKASDMLLPVSSKLPLGNISDEVLLGVLAIVGKKTIGRKVPLANQIFNGALIVESARIGEAVATGTVGIGNSTKASSGYMLG